MDELCALHQLGFILSHPIMLHSALLHSPPILLHPIYIDHVMLIFEFMIGRVELVWSSRHLNPFNRNNISRFNTSLSVLVSWKSTNWKRTRTVTVQLYLRTYALPIFHFSASDHTLTGMDIGYVWLDVRHSC